MNWLNLDIHGFEIESNDTFYCPECDQSVKGEVVAVDELYERIVCERCGYGYTTDYLNLSAWQLQQYLLAGSEWDEGLWTMPMFDIGDVVAFQKRRIKRSEMS